MQPIPIKINKPPSQKSNEAKRASGNSNHTPPPAKPQRSNRPKYFWPLLVLIVIESAIIAWLYLIKPISPYSKILPQDSIASSYFNQSSLFNLLKARTGWPPIGWGANALQNLLNKAQIKQPEQILKLFDEKMAFAVLPSNSGEETTWLLLASINVPDETFSQTRNKTEQTLKQEYNLINELYRQIKISQIKPLEREGSSLFYGRVKEYFILTNSENSIKTAIDKIIK